MKRILAYVLLGLLLTTSAYAEDLYIAQSSAGAADGSSCANALAVTFFNNAANWGAGAGKISAGDTAHLCGTFTGGVNTSMLTVQASGTAGNVITILFETGAKLTSVAWSPNGAIVCTSKSYITIDGGTNGIIENTDNGTSLGHTLNSGGIVFTDCLHTVVRNLTIQNLYVRTGTSSDGAGSAAVYYSGTSDDMVAHHNTINHARMGIFVAYNTVTSASFYNNTLNDHCWGIALLDNNNGSTAAGVTVHDNTIGPEFASWSDNISDTFHFDGIFFAATNASTSFTNSSIYNNYLHGNMNVHGTGYIFLTATSSMSGITVYNNVIVHEQNGPNGSTGSPEANIVTLGHITVGIYNNTLTAGGQFANGVRYWEPNAGALTLKNNIFTGLARAIDFRPNDFTSLAASNNNVFYNNLHIGAKNGGVGPYTDYNTLAAWQGQGFDANSVATNPNLNGTYHLQTGSSASNIGANLTSLGITALDSDKDGVARPGGATAWDAGAYQFVALPGLLDDGLSHPPPTTGTYTYNTFVPANTIGTSYTDPVFGATVKRLTTDHATDDIYARNMWWNADETRYFHRGKIINLVSNTVEYTGIPVGSLNFDVGFDPVDPNVLYYLSGASIHKVTLQGGGTWSDVVYFTTPGSATILSLGGTLNWLDASGRYMVLRYGSEPSVHIYDRNNLGLGAYANPVDGASTVGNNGYVGISPDGKYLVGYQDGSGAYPAGSNGISWAINHAGRSVATTGVKFWSLCGDHGSVVSASDGRNYLIVFDCNATPGLWRADITNDASGMFNSGTFTQQHTLPHNTLLIGFPGYNDFGHVSSVAKGTYKDWAFMSSEDNSDGFNGPTSPWHTYRQEIIAVNVITGEVRRLAHHRSRGGFGDYYSTPRLSSSWSGNVVGFASNFNQSGVDDIYAIPFAGTSSPDTTPPTVSMTAPSNGATVSGTAVTVSANASDNVDVVGVQFKLDGANLGVEDTTAPYALSWNTTSTSNGAHTLTAVARDAAGNTATSAAVSVTVANDTTPPTVSITAPANGATVSGTAVTVSATASDDVGVDGVQFKLDGANLGTEDTTAPYSISWNTTLTADGSHTLTADARDAAGNTATSTAVSVTVANGGCMRLSTKLKFTQGIGLTASKC